MSQSAAAPSTPRIPRRWLGLARAAWWVLAIYPSLLFLLGLAPYFSRLHQPCDPPACFTDNQWVLTSAQALELRASGISLDLYAALVIAPYFYLAAVCTACGLLIFLRRPDERIAYIASLALIVLGTYLIAGPVHSMVAGALPWLAPLAHLTYLWGNWVFPALLFLLPDGRFVPRWSRWFFFLLLAVMSIGVLANAVIGTTAPDSPFSRLASLILIVCAAAGAYGQVYRYRRVATPLEHKQILWIGLGLAGVALGSGVFVSIPTIVPSTGQDPITTRLAGFAFAMLGYSCLPIALTISILRYRLWDIDLIIRRTLIYASLSALLVGVYLGSVVLLQALVGALTGQSRSELVTVLSTLAIAALVVPLRRRVQAAIDRRFYRRKYDAARVLAAFGATLREETDLARLSEGLVGVVDQTMQPGSASLWLRPPGG